MLSSPVPSLIQSGTFTPRSRRENVKLRCIVLLATLVACLGAVSFGFVLGYSSPVETRIKASLNWSDDTFTWFSAVSGLGALLGSNIGGYAIEKYGRKLTIMLCSVPFVGGWVMVAASKTALVFVGRTITGLGVGAISLTVPVYIAEVSPANFRGTLGSFNQLGVTFGALLAYGLGPVIHSWHWIAIIGGIVPTLMILLMTIMPETPRWLIKQGRIAEAIQVLQHLRGGTFEDSEEECHEIQKTLGGVERFSLSEIKDPTVYRPLLLAVLLMVFQQFSGINVVIAYASELLNNAGFNNSESYSIIIAVVQVVVTAISCLIVDKFGRRVLLVFPGILMATSMAVLGATQYVHGLNKYIALVSLLLFITGFSLGWGALPWVIMSEVFPIRVRGVCGGIATMVNWLGVFAVTKTYNELEGAICRYGAYWFYAAVCLLSAVYVFFFLPETKGLTLEETEELFSNQRDIQL